MSFHEYRDVKKTRKRHRCCWCSVWIDEGSATKYYAGFSEDFSSGHMHLECFHAMEAAMNDPENEFMRNEGWGFWVQGRGRMDEECGPPQFNPDGTKVQDQLIKL